MASKAENLARIKAAFTALESAETTLATAQRGLDGLDPVILETIPAGRLVHIPGTRFSIEHDGAEVSINREDPELSIDDLLGPTE